MRRTQLYLPENLYEEVRERAHRERKSMAAVVREAVERYVAAPAEAEEDDDRFEYPPEEDDPLMKLIGMGTSNLTDGAENHDKYIYGDDVI